MISNPNLSTYKAVEKSELREKEMAIIRKFMAANMHGVEITDEELLYGQIDLGKCEAPTIALFWLQHRHI